ncbi:hypothetical protein G6011_09515 [Alternaria panax]|uniref:SRP9 domain-containing protein n=1 Tax=Alternaria panax TaxID=48097 RepID=A0AAD4IB61_9PLEO|nr:hypothetical protein G6011_09515 [Alternaria panax]
MFGLQVNRRGRGRFGGADIRPLKPLLPDMSVFRVSPFPGYLSRGAVPEYPGRSRDSSLARSSSARDPAKSCPPTEPTDHPQPHPSITPDTTSTMPYFDTSAEWYEQSSLLLKARPTTTRITSKYSVLKPTASKIKKRQKYEEKRAARAADATDNTQRATSPPPQPQNPEEVTVFFTLKTYDPESGTCLQYETNKGAEVGRLIGNLGRLGRHMAALPETAEDLSVPAGGERAATPQVDEGGDVKMGGVPAAGTGAGGKKKKKGKK